jgi:hypothetical protein
VLANDLRPLVGHEVSGARDVLHCQIVDIIVDPLEELGRDDGVIGSHEHKGRRLESSIPVGAAQDACCLRVDEVAVESGDCAGASRFSKRREKDLDVLIRQRVLVVHGVQKH